MLPGLVSGAMLFVAAVFLVEKLPRPIKYLALRHYLVTDIILTALSFLAFPVVGAVTLLTSASFCVFISIYLAIRKTQVFSDASVN